MGTWGLHRLFFWNSISNAGNLQLVFLKENIQEVSELEAVQDNLEQVKVVKDAVIEEVSQIEPVQGNLEQVKEFKDAVIQEMVKEDIKLSIHKR